MTEGIHLLDSAGADFVSAARSVPVLLWQERVLHKVFSKHFEKLLTVLSRAEDVCLVRAARLALLKQPVRAVLLVDVVFGIGDKRVDLRFEVGDIGIVTVEAVSVCRLGGSS